MSQDKQGRGQDRPEHDRHTGRPGVSPKGAAGKSSGSQARSKPPAGWGRGGGNAGKKPKK